MTVVVVIEPDEQRRQGILQLLASEEPSFKLEGVDYAGLFQQTPASFSPDLALLYVHSYEDLFELTHATKLVYAPRHMLLVSATNSVPHSLPRLRPILAGYVHESAPSDLLMASIRLVLAGGECFPLPLSRSGIGPEYPASIIPQTLSAPLSSPGDGARSLDGVRPGLPRERLQRTTHKAGTDPSVAVTEAEMLRITPRQYEVLVLLARGYPIKTVSRHLNISVSTAKAHTETLYQRLDVNNRSEAVYAAFARGATLGWDQHDQPMGSPKPGNGAVT
ncbi:MAG TPA: response regulator transcription factor [Eoetvoesiella sp.]